MATRDDNVIEPFPRQPGFRWKDIAHRMPQNPFLVMQALLKEFAAGIVRDARKEGRPLPLSQEEIEKSLIALYDAGLIIFTHDEEKERFGLEKWDFERGCYCPC